MKHSLVRLAFVAVAAFLAACAKTPPPPTVSLAGRACSAGFDLKTAQALAVDKDKPVTVTLDEHAPCIEDGSGKSNYSVFTLPPTTVPYILQVASLPQGDGLFSPVLRLLDAGGKQTRDISRDTFSFHGTALHVGLRPHPEEAYLVVMSDPTTVGQNVSKLIETTMASTGSSGRFAFTIHTGAEATPTFTYSHTGIITVSAQPLPAAH